ncbi:hypothetical protein LINGRAHAP2_LOCUS14492 [Linum grandiflorum]
MKLGLYLFFSSSFSCFVSTASFNPSINRTPSIRPKTCKARLKEVRVPSTYSHLQ